MAETASAKTYTEEEVKDMLFQILDEKKKECCCSYTSDSIVRKVLEQHRKEVSVDK